MEHNRQEEDALSSLSTESYRVLENIALNDENTLPWPELRRIIRQRLSQTIEMLQTQGSNSSNSKIEQEDLEPLHDAAKDSNDVNEPSAEHSAEAETTAPAIESSRKRSKSEAGIETNGIVHAKSGKEGTADGESPPLETNQRESTLGAEEQPRQNEEDDKENVSDSGAMPQRESPKDVLTAEGDDILSREICDLEDRVNYCLQSFDEAPFTIQRIAELLVWPERHYRGAIKFLRAIERVVYVTSTVEDFPPTTTETKEPTDSANDEVEDDMDNIPVAIEGVGGSVGGATAPPSSLFSFLASQDTPASVTTGIISGMSGDIVDSVATKAIAAKEKQPAMSLTAVVASTLGLQANGEIARPQEPGDAWATRRLPPPPPPLPHVASESRTIPLAVGGSEGVPPLDASDTGILHITSTSSEEGDALRSRISESVDASIPVCIDGPNGSVGEFVVQPVNPLHIPAPELTTSEVTGFVDERKSEKNKSANE